MRAHRLWDCHRPETSAVAKSIGIVTLLIVAAAAVHHSNWFWGFTGAAKPLHGKFGFNSSHTGQSDEPARPDGALPAGFDAWLQYAERHRCELHRYEQMERDLQPFRDLLAREGPAAMAAALSEAQKLRHTAVIDVKDGRADLARAITGNAAYAGPRYLAFIRRFQEHLPDMRLVVNLMDEPRVLLGPGSVQERYGSATCAGASQDFHKSRHLHGYIISPTSAVTDASTLMPVLSQTKILGCHSDIMIPSHYNHEMNRAKKHQVPDWERRRDVLYWRGSTTGGVCRGGEDFRKFHRQRLVEAGRNCSDMDLAFTAIIACDDTCCKDQQALYGTAERVSRSTMWQYKYQMVIDGNSFNSRLPLLLSSNSVVFRAGLFAEWFDERLVPGRHLLPVRLDLSDLRAQLNWAKSHDRKARAMAEAAKQLVSEHMRLEDIQCYTWRLLLEYAALFAPSNGVANVSTSA
mmetsp:Transcript_3879/g.11239  ORF Transcript_3879/g.11239 Transcript_3879/m.11239 type:complete len:462 (+) Transcript_3879:334-1719(+)